MEYRRGEKENIEYIQYQSINYHQSVNQGTGKIYARSFGKVTDGNRNFTNSKAGPVG